MRHRPFVAPPRRRVNAVDAAARAREMTGDDATTTIAPTDTLRRASWAEETRRNGDRDR